MKELKILLVSVGFILSGVNAYADYNCLGRYGHTNVLVLVTGLPGDLSHASVTIDYGAPPRMLASSEAIVRLAGPWYNANGSGFKLKVQMTDLKGSIFSSDVATDGEDILIDCSQPLPK